MSAAPILGVLLSLAVFVRHGAVLQIARGFPPGIGDRRPRLWYWRLAASIGSRVYRKGFGFRLALLHQWNARQGDQGTLRELTA